MNHQIVISLLCFMLSVTINAAEFSYHRNMFRNMKLRLLIACNYKKYKNSMEFFNHLCLEKLFHIQENAKIKYMEITNKYYSLSDEDRYAIENIIDMIL